MEATIRLRIPEEAVYPGVVADALKMIAADWDKGATSGRLTPGMHEVTSSTTPVEWDSRVDDEHSTSRRHW